MISIIKNKYFDKIDGYIEKHIVAPTNEWIRLIDDNEEIRRYLKQNIYSCVKQIFKL